MKPTILCVDDDRNLLKILGRALAGEGYAVRFAHDGEAALAGIADARPDLVLLDLLLPKRDGFSVLETLRGLDRPIADVPVVLLSGCTLTPEYRERAERLRASEFLTKPVPLAFLLERVAKHLDRSAPAPAAAQRKPAARRAALLSGTLQELPFPALLHQLHGLRATGVLQLAWGKKRKALQLRDGYPIAVRSNLVNECLGNQLVSTGRISKAILDESLKRMKRGEGLQGEILVAMDMLSERELGAALRAQAEEKLYEIFEWTGGSFELRRGGRLERANALALDGSPANVILDGVRRRFPIGAVDELLRRNAERSFAHSESPFYRFQEIHLEPAERALLRGLGAGRQVGEFLGADEATRRTLYALVAAEMIELRAPVVPAQPDPQAGEAGRARSAPASTPAAADRPRAPEPAPTPADARTPSEPADGPEEALRAELAATAERLRGSDYFDVLGVDQKADDDAIRRAYVAAAKRLHPDRYSGSSAPVKHLAEDIFRVVSEAYETLVDDKRRLEYVLQLRRGAREQAEIEEGQRALEAELQFQKGEVLMRRKDFLGALGCFHQATRIYPEEGEYHAYQGMALYLSRPEELAEAIELVKQGAKLAPDREKPYLFLGRLTKAQGRTRLAERFFTRVVQINPDSVEALRELRLIHMRREKDGKGLIRRLIRR